MTKPRFALTTLLWSLIVCAIRAHAQQTTSPFQEIDKLYLTTTRIETFVGNTRLGTATGFFMEASEPKKLFLITNRHVVIDEKKTQFPDRLRLRLHVDSINLVDNAFYDVSLYDERKNKRWREINPSIDVIAIELPVRDLAKFHFKAFLPNDFASPGTRLGIGEPVVIIGYPAGFYDDRHNLPVGRQGAIASAFPIPFQGNPYFLVDAILHPGTSGSPVITRPVRTMLTSGTQAVFGPPVQLIGVNSATPGLNLYHVWFTSVVAQLMK